MSAHPDDDEYLDEEPPEDQRSIFATGWFRALVVLLGLAIVAVVSLPYLLDWMDQSRKPAAPGTAAVQPAAPSAPAPTPAAQPERTPTGTTAPAAKPETSRPASPQPGPPTPPPATKEAPKPMGAQTATPASPPAPKADVKPAPKPAPRPDAAKAKPAPAAAETPKTGGTPTGDYWLQVGAYQDERNATRTVEALRKQNLQVQTARVTRAQAGGTRHEVFVTGASADRVNAALRGAGTAQTVEDGIVVRPALELKDAVALSKRLAGEGLQVKIRRTQGSGGAPGTFYLVRVGPYPDRAAVEAARKELDGKKVAAFITQGPPK